VPQDAVHARCRQVLLCRSCSEEAGKCLAALRTVLFRGHHWNCFTCARGVRRLATNCSPVMGTLSDPPLWKMTSSAARNGHTLRRTLCNVVPAARIRPKPGSARIYPAYDRSCAVGPGCSCRHQCAGSSRRTGASADGPTRSPVCFWSSNQRVCNLQRTGAVCLVAWAVRPTAADWRAAPDMHRIVFTNKIL
jgi:hypothetical protein